jgi:predicted amidohydrolase
MIVEPWGEVLASQISEPGIATAEIDLEQQRARRQSFQALQHRRLP